MGFDGLYDAFVLNFSLYKMWISTTSEGCIRKIYGVIGTGPCRLSSITQTESNGFAATASE